MKDLESTAVAFLQPRAEKHEVVTNLGDKDDGTVHGERAPAQIAIALPGGLPGMDAPEPDKNEYGIA